MLGLSLYENIGVFGGLVLLVVVLIVVLRPLKLHVTVKHENGRKKKEDE